MRYALHLKWTKVHAGLYQCGEWRLTQARWRASPDGWMIGRGDRYIDSSRLLSSCKRRVEDILSREIAQAICLAFATAGGSIGT